MAVIFSEDFEVSPDNTTLTTSNTSASNTTGTTVSDSGQAIVGTYSALFATTSAIANMRFDFTNDTDAYFRFYLRLDALPPANLAIITFATSAGVTTGDFRVTTTGTLQIRNQALTLVDTSSTVLTVDAWHRIEIHHTTTRIEARVFKDPDYNSTTPTEGEGAFGGTTSAASGIGRWTTGVNNSSTNTLWIDDLVADDAAWVGPAVTPDADVSLTTVAAVTTVPAATIAADADTTPTTIAAQTALDTPTVTATADASVILTTVAGVAAISASTQTADANLTLTTVVATASIDTPAVVATSPNADVTPSTVVGIAAIPVPEVIGNANAPPADIAAIAAIPTPSVTADAAVTPSEVVAVAAISVPVVSIEIDITVGNVSAVTTVPTPGVTTGAELNADVVFLDVPVNLAAVPFDADRIDLSWDAVTGASEYLVERDGVVVATNPDTTYSDTGLDPETTYSYRVKAVA